jgi:hypothetical protein
VKNFLKSLFRGTDSSPVERPLPPDAWPAVLRELRSQRDRVDDYFRHSVLPKVTQPLGMFHRAASLPTAPTSGFTAFFAHRALNLVADLEYVAPQHGLDFADALCTNLYGSEGFRSCPHLAAFIAAGDNIAVRECFAGRMSDSLCGQGTGEAVFIRPFALMAACDVDFLCCAATAEAFGDDINAQGMLKQRDEFLAKSPNA